MSVANQAKKIWALILHVEGVSEDDTIKRMFSEPMIMGWGSSPMTSYMLYPAAMQVRQYTGMIQSFIPVKNG